MKRGWSPTNWEFTSYKWNERSKTIKEVPTHKYDFDSVEANAESLMYKENDYRGAIVYLNIALAQAPSDRVMCPDCYRNIAQRKDGVETQPTIALCDQPMEWHRPYLLYLLGLSYETLGRLEDARNTCYALWHEDPENVFGVAASLRLGLVSP